MSPSFRHMFAYGNSDQASFRNLDVQSAFDVMTVPGTIAAYYSEGTAGFVLSSQLDYLIDPRTPLFQETLDVIRASHHSLGEWHGASVTTQLQAGEPAYFPSSFWTSPVVSEMVDEVISRQRSYAGNAPLVEKKLSRYARLLAQAMNDQGAPAPKTEAKPPYAVLAPYFAVSGETDPWWAVMKSIWGSCLKLDNPQAIIPVLCVDGRPTASVDGVSTLQTLLPLLPSGLSPICFFWITNFDERKVAVSQLRALWSVIKNAPEGRRLVNMYGGFFSICLRYAGLRGFGNGLTYSESRDWPALSSTGAAPARYYIRDLHLFLPQALAATLTDIEPSFVCPCTACADWIAMGNSIASLPYPDLKRHFALARKWELELTANSGASAIATLLRDASARAAAVRKNLALAGLPATDYLGRWAEVLETF